MVFVFTEIYYLSTIFHGEQMNTSYFSIGFLFSPLWTKMVVGLIIIASDTVLKKLNQIQINLKICI